VARWAPAIIFAYLGIVLFFAHTAVHAESDRRSESAHKVLRILCGWGIVTTITAIIKVVIEQFDGSRM
jgi:hypothetical protein